MRWKLAKSSRSTSSSPLQSKVRKRGGDQYDRAVEHVTGVVRREPARDIPVCHECDVCVIGGSTTGVFVATSNPWTVGNRITGDRGFDGVIDEVFVDARVLSPTEITARAGHCGP